MTKNKTPQWSVGNALRFSSLLCVFSVALVSTLSASIPQYTATLINMEGGVSSWGHDINDSGHVVGQMTWNSTAGRRSQAFLYADGEVTILGTLGEGRSSTAYGINSLGQIVGESATTTSGANPVTTAFLYSGGEMISLGIPDLPQLDGSFVPATASRATAINDSGQIVMWARGFRPNGFLYDSASEDPTAERIPYHKEQTLMVTDINNHGVIVGTAQTEPTVNTAVRYSNGTFTHLGTLDPVSLRFSETTAVNDHGVIVGHSHANGNFRGFIYYPEGSGGLTDVGTLRPDNSGSTQISDINNEGQIIGTTTIDEFNAMYPFLRDKGNMYNLNNLIVQEDSDASVVLNQVLAINNWGQIVAWSESGGGVGFTYLLNPLSFLTAVTVDGDQTTHSIKALAGMDYGAYEVSEAPEGSFVAALIGGQAMGNREILITYTGERDARVLSEVIRVEGTEDDLFVLQLAYDPTLEEFMDPTSLYLGWLDETDNTWKNAVAGNSDDNAELILGAFDPEQHLIAGYYGVDTENHQLWAVLDHNSLYAVIPEPSTWGVGLLGIAALFTAWYRRRKR